MNYIISPKCWLFSERKRCFVFQSPHQQWEVSTAVMQLLSRFSSPQLLPAIGSLCSDNSNGVARCLEQLKNEGIVVEDTQGDFDWMQSLVSSHQTRSVFVYADPSVSREIIIYYADFIQKVVDLIEQNSGVFLKPFRACLFSDEKTFRDILNSTIPSWAQGVVSRGCLLQKIAPQRLVQSHMNPIESSALRAMVHEVGHILTYQHCCYVPNWLSEGISEYLATSIFPEQWYSSYEFEKGSSLEYFFTHPMELLIAHDTHQPFKNRLYCEAGNFVRNILRGRSLESLLVALSNYSFTPGMDLYLEENGFLQVGSSCAAVE